VTRTEIEAIEQDVIEGRVEVTRRLDTYGFTVAYTDGRLPVVELTGEEVRAELERLTGKARWSEVQDWRQVVRIAGVMGVLRARRAVATRWRRSD
jgi:hypothetical protein